MNFRDVESSAQRKKRVKREEPDFPVKPTTVQVCNVSRSMMNHSYRDFSKVPPSKGDYESPKEIKDMAFAQKVHHILSQEDYEKWISWMPHGRAFKVHVPVLFENQICPKYFGHKRYSSFLRELNNYGFKHISKGTDRNCYYHEMMLKGRPHLCEYMPPPRDARRLVADPENEPDLYKISRLYPLDGSETENQETAEPSPKRARTNESKAESTAIPSVVPPVVTSISPVLAPGLSQSATFQTSSSSVPTIGVAGGHALSERDMLLAYLEAKQKMAQMNDSLKNPSVIHGTSRAVSARASTLPSFSSIGGQTVTTGCPTLNLFGGHQRQLSQYQDNNLALLAAQLLLKKKEQEEAAAKLAFAVGLFGK